MKAFLFLVAVAGLWGCGQRSAGPAPNPANDALIEKLNGMPPSQRDAYVKAHMDEVMRAASQPAVKGAK